MPRVLVIEDAVFTLRVLEEQLRLAGFEVLKAMDGEEGIKMAKEHCPDAIICDIMLPRADGYAVLREIRAYEPMATVPFIFLTAKATRQDIRKGFALTADDYLVKPVSGRVLIAALHKQLKSSPE
ncbi:MAG: response regulator [Gemmatimonadetes bacterium]|nr:MAG: response regulator [Gemmatimonadota bacterium]